MVVCEICSKEFLNSNSLGVHRARAHGVNERICVCGKSLNNRKAFHKHKLKCDVVITKNGTDNGKAESSSHSIKCGHCEHLLPSIIDLCNHLNSVHHENMEINNASFDNFEAFQKWLSETKHSEKCDFVRSGAVKETKLGRKFYYYCHRSGTFRSEGSNQRAPKEGVTNKIGFHCSAFVTAVENIDKTVSTTYCLQHYKHDNKLFRIHLPIDIKQQIAQFILDGRNTDWIFKKMREDFENGINRKNLVTAKDLKNIEKAYGLRKAEKSRDDATSVALWVMEQEQSENSNLFAYTPYNPETKQYSLGIMTEYQAEMLKKHGNEVICVDSTHGTTMYPFLLVTVLVLDEFQNGFPAAWFITSNENKEMLSLFFTELRKRVGKINCKYFMSDDANAFWNAWEESMNPDEKSTTKLLCTWHILKNWRQKLVEKVLSNDSECIATIWHTLLILKQESSESNFKNLLTKFLSDLDESGEIDFLQYFQREYLSV